MGEDLNPRNEGVSGSKWLFYCSLTHYEPLESTLAGHKNGHRTAKLLSRYLVFSSITSQPADVKRLVYPPTFLQILEPAALQLGQLCLNFSVHWFSSDPFDEKSRPQLPIWSSAGESELLAKADIFGDQSRSRLEASTGNLK